VAGVTEPRIRYATTADGISIAYWTLGEGYPLVYMPIPPFSHILLEWEMPECREQYERLSKQHMLVRYDGRGCGLSDRDIDSYSIDSQILDLEAVVNSLGLERFALMVSSHWGPVGIAYAARNPERVSNLILWCCIASGSEFFGGAQVEARIELLQKDFELYSETTAHVLYGWSVGEPARRIAKLIRESITQQTLVAEIAESRQFDVSGLLPVVSAPTLVLQRREHPVLDVSVAKRLASRIPAARLVLVEGSSLAPYLGDSSTIESAIAEFLGDRPAETSEAKERVSAFRTLLFTDLVGHTEMMYRLGDERGRAVLREHERITREVLKAHGGTEVKTMGDGFMASFGSVTKAVECAIALQRAFAEREGEPLSVRVGLNAGEPIEEDGDLFGATVILASRIAARAEGGEILVADTVRGLCSGKGFLFSDRGEFVAKGFEEPVRVYEVRWRE
jgi:class 3 adenylate cyclase